MIMMDTGVAFFGGVVAASVGDGIPLGVLLAGIFVPAFLITIILMCSPLRLARSTPIASVRDPHLAYGTTFANPRPCDAYVAPNSSCSGRCRRPYRNGDKRIVFKNCAEPDFG